MVWGEGGSCLHLAEFVQDIRGDQVANADTTRAAAVQVEEELAGGEYNISRVEERVQRGEFGHALNLS